MHERTANGHGSRAPALMARAPGWRPVGVDQADTFSMFQKNCTGEPSRTTAAEQQVLAAKGVTGVRLSCQIVCDHDMTVRAISRLEGSGRPDPGRTPEPTIQPPPEWI